MIVKTISGQLHAIAESVDDVRRLLALTRETKAKTSTPAKLYKKTCPVCGKRVKYLDVHNKVMHGEGRLLGSVHGDLAGRVPVREA